MSVVPYNSNNDIVYLDSSHGIVVLHNDLENKLEVVTLNNELKNNFDYFQMPGNDRKRYARGGNNIIKCPNCGFSWPSGPIPNTKRERQTGHPSSDFFDINSINDNGKYVQEIPERFMHNDYFKLLSNIEYFDGKKLFQDSSRRLPESVFNQGYFKKFFKKVYPYTLGSGARAQVYKVAHELNGITLGTFAVKRINVGDKLELLPQVLNEVLILNELSEKGSTEHNLIRYNHVWLEMGDIEDLDTFFLSNGDSCPNQGNRVPYMFILQQYCDGGHLEDLLVKSFKDEDHLCLKERVQRERLKRRLSKSGASSDFGLEYNQKEWPSDFEIWKLFRDVAKAVSFLHLHCILHRDLKPSNCLLETKYDVNVTFPTHFANLQELDECVNRLPRVLVSDFGEGKFTDERHLSKRSRQVESRDEARRGNTGTLEFTCPELWAYSKYTPSLECESQLVRDFSFSSDVYSLGLILCWLCVGSLPFSEEIKDSCDPDNIRALISNWYNDLEFGSFCSWFKSAASRKRHTQESSKALGHYCSLIYSMIRGSDAEVSENESRILSAEVLKELENMKWSCFLAQERNEIDEVLTLSDRQDDVVLADPSSIQADLSEEEVDDKFVYDIRSPSVEVLGPVTIAKNEEIVTELWNSFTFINVLDFFCISCYISGIVAIEFFKIDKKELKIFVEIFILSCLTCHLRLDLSSRARVALFTFAFISLACSKYLAFGNKYE